MAPSPRGGREGPFSRCKGTTFFICDGAIWGFSRIVVIHGLGCRKQLPSEYCKQLISEWGKQLATEWGIQLRTESSNQLGTESSIQLATEIKELKD